MRTVIVKVKFDDRADTEAFFATLDASMDEFNADPELRGESEATLECFETTPGLPDMVRGNPPRYVDFVDWIFE